MEASFVKEEHGRQVKDFEFAYQATLLFRVDFVDQPIGVFVTQFLKNGAELPTRPTGEMGEEDERG